MEVILLEAITNLGELGDKVSVKAGYGRNFLIPQGKAVPASAEAVAEFEARRAELERAAAEAEAVAKARAESIEGLDVVIIEANAGEEGKLFGSVGTRDIAAALASVGCEVDKAEVKLPDGALRELGDYTIALQLHAEVMAEVSLSVVPEPAA